MGNNWQSEFEDLIKTDGITLLGCLRENGLSIPEDVAITGFDNILISSFANPALSIVHHNTKLAG